MLSLIHAYFLACSFYYTKRNKLNWVQRYKKYLIYANISEEKFEKNGLVGWRIRGIF